MKLLIAALIPALAPAHGSIPREISTIYSYQCVRTFIEGEGVRAGSIRCPAYQQLGLIQTTATNYLFASRSENNFDEKLRSKAYPAPVCGLALPQLSCADQPLRTEFGLSRHYEGIFRIAVAISPTQSGTSRIYGYASSLNRDGSCPAPLVKANILVARPETIDYPLPSSFVNHQGKLNEQIIKVEGEPLPHYLMHRQASAAPCDERGNCRKAKFDEPFLVQLAPFEPMPEALSVCVLPKKYITRD
jgi:hypothetical protein